MYGFDLDELPELDRELRLFSYNRWNVVSLRDGDYLGDEPGTIRGKLERALAERGAPSRPARVYVVTAARYFGYVFNPVSFYYCHGAGGELEACVAEVNNTFGERHLYVLHGAPEPASPGMLAKYTRPKDFHVSPFYDRLGDYVFEFGDIGRELDIRLDIERDGGKSFLASLKGTRLALSDATIARTIATRPIQAAMTMPRILWQAARLHYEKRLPVFRKPMATSIDTIRVSAPSPTERLAMKGVLSKFAAIRHGALHLRTPDRREHLFGDPTANPIRVEVDDYAFFRMVALRADVGLGEAYTAGYWRASDLAAFIRLLIDNRTELEGRSAATGTISLLRNAIRFFTSRNTLSGSRKNIEFHYDLGNDFYELFLDNHMLYSSAIFDGEDDNLEDAQLRKVHRLVDNARITADDHVLEIGSGWGTFAIEAAKTTGCRVTTITLSKEQHRHVRQRIREEGLAGQVRVLLKDYRNLRGKYDKIVSIEMIEAVGHEHLPAFFAACDRVLAPNGILALQAITVADFRYPAYLKHGDWIQHHIFPGAVVPSVSALLDAAASKSEFVMEESRNYAPHYARTLRTWRERFFAHLDGVRALGFDDAFIRTWEYYLCYCEAGFASRTLGLRHLTFSRPNNVSLDNGSAPAKTHAATPSRYSHAA